MDGSTIGYVVSAGDVTVIAFRGTDVRELSDWLVNLNGLSSSTPHGAIHSGFYAAYNRLAPQAVLLLKERNPLHLWVTGHSLGGALASVCACDLTQNEKRSLDGIITFGQPMVARKQLADYLDSMRVGRYAHYMNEADIVPKVPPAFRIAAPWCGSREMPSGARNRHGAAAPGEAPTQDGEDLATLTDEEFSQIKAGLASKQKKMRLSPLPTEGRFIRAIRR
ncbi:MAG: lipase family protein [Isosphaeraceae bacterium]|nr:lipase family protein [Isosphaeraceae bacterium]